MTKNLGLKALALVNGVSELGKAIRMFAPVDKKFETLRQPLLAVTHPTTIRSETYSYHFASLKVLLRACEGPPVRQPQASIKPLLTLYQPSIMTSINPPPLWLYYGGIKAVLRLYHGSIKALLRLH